jgi:hypothetical protein
MNRVSFSKTNFGGERERDRCYTTTYDDDILNQRSSLLFYLRRSATMILFIGVIDLGMDAKST